MPGAGSFDLAYLTEVDPLWNDDELTLILNPDAVLFANPIAIAACAADCVAATVGFGLNTLFWCAGCQGGLYPMDGHVQYHMGGVRTAALLAQRLTAKMHRELIAWGWHGSRGLCGPYLSRSWTSRPTRPPHLPDSVDRQARGQSAASRSAARPCSGAQARGVPGPGRGLRLHALPQEGTAVWATDRLVAACCVDRGSRCLPPWLRPKAGSVRQEPRDRGRHRRATRSQPTITDTDIEAARRKHRMPSDENSPVPVRATYRRAASACSPKERSTSARSPVASMPWALPTRQFRAWPWARRCWSS